MAKILIKGGRVWDGEKFFYADILTENGKIAKTDKDIDGGADFVFDATGKTVSAGLVDAHVHISGGKFGTHPAMSTLPFGVTAAADAGVGFPELLVNCGLKHTVFVSVKTENNRADFTNTVKTLSECGEKAIGLKIYFDRTLSSLSDITALRETVDFAEEHGLSVMVHSSNPPVTMAELLKTLRRGDILTHAYHGGTNNASEDDFACIKEAKMRGVIIDAGMAGHVHTDFEVFKKAIACGAIPDIISTDITNFSAYKRGGRFGLPMCMSIARDLGMSEEDIFKAVTRVPARAIGMDECGTLKVGGCADIAVLEYADEGYSLTDKAGNRAENSKGYRNILTVVNGEVVYIR